MRDAINQNHDRNINNVKKRHQFYKQTPREFKE